MKEVGPIKKTLIDRIAKETGIIDEDIRLVLDNAFKNIRIELTRGGIVMIREFGKFSVRVRGPKKVNFLGGFASKEKNPRQMILPETKIVKFRPANTFEID